VWARHAGMKAAGRPVPQTENLRLTECAQLNSLTDNLAEARDARDRVRRGRLGEPPALQRPCTPIIDPDTD
jgi:coenzyme F420 hydrogenase subunit beta